MPKHQPKHMKKRIPIRMKISLFFLPAFIVSCGMFVYSSQKAQYEKENLAALAKSLDETIVSIQADEVPTVKSPKQSTQKEPVILKKYRKLYEQNADMAGWIQIEGTVVNYPVMLTPENEEYYLHRDFEQTYAYSGLPFIGKKTSLDSDNLIIYGHNMKNKTMFSSLLLYAKEEYWKEHPVIPFDTIYAEQEYEIVGAFYSKVYYSDETDVFRYYNYGGDLSEQEYAEYIKQVQDVALYETGITPQYGDQLITLSTCSYHVSDGRFVVVAKKI